MMSRVLSNEIIFRTRNYFIHSLCITAKESSSINSSSVTLRSPLNPHAPDRLTPSRARFADNCGSALTHRLFGKK